jgi:predicted MFS family arabinose efflux permease
MLIVYFGINNSNKPSPKSLAHSVPTKQIFYHLKSSGLSKELIFIFSFLFFLNISWFSFIKFFQVHLYEEFSLNESLCCKATSALGASCAMWQIVRTLSKTNFFDKNTWFFLGSLIMFIASIFHILNKTQVGIIISVLLFTFSYSTLIPSIIARVFMIKDKLANEYKSSLYQCIQSASKILAPLITGIVTSTSGLSPAWVSTYSVAVCLIIYSIRLRPLAAKETSLKTTQTH